MRDAFRSFYRPSEAESGEIWRNGLVVLDASFLLNLYRYSERTRSDVLATLEKLKEKLWLPHQAGLEFHRNRPSVMHEHARKFSAMRGEFESARKRVEALYRDPSSEMTDAASLEEAWERLDSYLAEHEGRSTQPTMAAEDDAVLAAVTELLDGRVGEPFSPDRLREIYSIGVDRYANKQPPGFEDEQKPEPERYGDLIVWLQMIEQAKTTQRPINFVTADEKRDWWWIHEGRTLGPLPSLIEEMFTESRQAYWAYKPDQFVSFAGPFVDQVTSSQAIEELRETHAPREAGEIDQSLTNDIAGLMRSIEYRRNHLRRGIAEARQRLDEARTHDDRLAAQERLDDLERRWRRTEVEEEALRRFADSELAWRPREDYERSRTRTDEELGSGKSTEFFRLLVQAIQRSAREQQDLRRINEYADDKPE